MKQISAKAILSKLTEELGHEPTSEEISKQLNGVGLIVLAHSVVNDEPTHVSFADNIDSELLEIPIPDINGLVRCKECLSYDHWEFRDADHDDEKKFFRYVCQGKLSPSYASFGNLAGQIDSYCLCENEATIYLDDENQPILKK